MIHLFVYCYIYLLAESVPHSQEHIGGNEQTARQTHLKLKKQTGLQNYVELKH